MKSDFRSKTAKIITEIMARTCIDDVDAEVIEDILQDELKEYCNELNEYCNELKEYCNELNAYCNELNEYYEEEYYNEVFRARNSAYDEGYSLGHSEGYSEGRSDGYSEGYSDGHSEVRALISRSIQTCYNF